MNSLKHLFYIHSYITYIVSASIAEDLALDHSDIIFVYGRGFSYQDYNDIRAISLPPDLMEFAGVPSYGERLLLLKRGRAIQKLDRFISDLVDGQCYFAYLPLSKNFLMSLIATHSKCRDLAFIEEGLLTYTGQFRKPTNRRYTDSVTGRIARLVKFVNHVGRSFVYRSYYHPSASIVYVIDDSIDLPDYDVRVVSKTVVPPIPDEYVLKDDILFVVDTVVEDGITSASHYKQAISPLIEMCNTRNLRHIWLRFRPNYSHPEFILDLFKENGIQVNIIPDSVCVESILFNSKNMVVFGLNSSLLFYAAIWGHEAYSALRILFDIDPAAEHRYHRMMQIPEVFLKRVKLIEPGVQS